MRDETGGDTKNRDDGSRGIRELEECGGRIRDKTERTDLRKTDLAEIGEPIRAERKDDTIEAGAARCGKRPTCPGGGTTRGKWRAPAVRDRKGERPEARRGLRRRAEVGIGDTSGGN
jgi:hypothetical protein